MTFILPNNPNGLRDFEQKLNTINIMEAVKYLKPITVTAEIPVFRIESSVNMIEPLKKVRCQFTVKSNPEIFLIVAS